MRCGPWKRSLSSSGSSVGRSSPGRRWATTCTPGGDCCKSRPWELGSSPLRPCHTGWSTSTQPCGVSEKAPHSRLGRTWAWVGSTSPEPPGRLRAVLGASGPDPVETRPPGNASVAISSRRSPTAAACAFRSSLPGPPPVSGVFAPLGARERGQNLSHG